MVYLEALRHLRRWALFAFLLNALWEVAQLPLYALWQDPERPRVVVYVLHCVAGDVLIATVLFLGAAALLRDLAWPAHRPWRGGFSVVAGGLVYTGFSEWYNVYQTHAWAYSNAMPLVFGIGLAPLLQWMAVPVLTIVAFRYRTRS